MKTIQLSGIIAMLFISVLTSCTKDSKDTLSGSSDFSTSGSNASSGRAASPNGGQVNNDKKAEATLDLSIASSPATLGSTVTFNCDMNFSQPVSQFVIVVEKATVKDLNGNWTNWTEQVGYGKEVKDIAATSTYLHSWNFTASEAGETAWRVRVTGRDVANSLSDEEVLIVTSCTGISLEEHIVSVSDEADADGYYTFLIDYTVNTCGVEYTKLKLQGGLTAGAIFLPELSSGGNAWTVGANGKNTIVNWLEYAPLPQNTKTYRVAFKKHYNGSGLIELTGEWTVKAEKNGVEVGADSVDPISYQK